MRYPTPEHLDEMEEMYLRSGVLLSSHPQEVMYLRGMVILDGYGIAAISQLPHVITIQRCHVNGLQFHRGHPGDFLTDFPIVFFVPLGVNHPDPRRVFTYQIEIVVLVDFETEHYRNQPQASRKEFAGIRGGNFCLSLRDISSTAMLLILEKGTTRCLLLLSFRLIACLDAQMNVPVAGP